MLELLCILAVVIYLLLLLSDYGRPESAPRSIPNLAGNPAPAESERPQLRLAIEGTQRAYLRSAKFLKRFGVSPQAVHDIRVYAEFGALADIPAAVVARLYELHERGCAVGADVMALLWHERGLRPGEAIYFTLVEARPEPRIVAFVDKLRSA